MRILAFPRDRNPYQELLYAEMRRLGATVDYLEGPTGSHTFNLLAMPLMLIRSRVQGYALLHLHWTYEFCLPWLGPLGRLAMEVYFLSFILFVKKANYKLVWTVHNVLPHERQFLHERFVRAFLAKHCDALIVHSRAVLGEMGTLHIPTDRAAVIPHGSYVGVYEDTVSRSAARDRLAVPQEAFVYLFFGQLRPYKGVERLLEAFERIECDSSILLLAGQCADEALGNLISASGEALGERMRVHLGYVADDEVQDYFRAADVCVLPFTHISTSGSAMLALSFGCPIVAPRSAAFSEFPDDVGYLYDARDDGALEDVMRWALRDAELLGRRGQLGRRLAESLSWREVAEKTHRVFRGVLDG